MLIISPEKLFSFSRLFGHEEKRPDQKDKVNFKVDDVTTQGKNNCNSVVVALQIALSAIWDRFSPQHVGNSQWQGFLTMVPSRTMAPSSLQVNNPTKTIHQQQQHRHQKVKAIRQCNLTSMRKFFLKKSLQNVVGKLFPGFFLKNKN